MKNNLTYSYVYISSRCIIFSKAEGRQGYTFSIMKYFIHTCNGLLTRYQKIVGCACTANAGNVSPLPRVSNSDMHHGTCVKHVAWCMSILLTSGFIWSRWREERSRHSRRMRKPRFYVSGKRSMGMIAVYYITGINVAAEVLKVYLNIRMSHTFFKINEYAWKINRNIVVQSEQVT